MYIKALFVAPTSKATLKKSKHRDIAMRVTSATLACIVSDFILKNAYLRNHKQA